MFGNGARLTRWTVAASVSTVVGLLGVLASPALTASAKDYDVAGTVDCGRRSGRHCDIGDTIQLWTEDLGGGRQLATIDVSWLKKLPTLDQDDPIDLEVRDMPGGAIQAIGVQGEGSFVDRENFGVREEYNGFRGSIRAHVGRARDDDEQMNDDGIRRFEDLHHHH